MTTYTGVEQLCTFRLGPLYLGIDVRDVREVVQHAEITMVPNADQAIDGLINLRGQIATAIDLCRRLEVEPLDADRNPIHLVILSEGEPVTLLVDSIGDVIDVDAADFEPPPATMTGIARELILGAYELLLILDIQKAVELNPSKAQDGA